MKKNLFFAALALVALASCSDEQFVGEIKGSPDPGTGPEQPIVFNSGAYAITRADFTGSDAAQKLGNNFVVEGVKSNGTSDSQKDVFDHYNVNWVANTANTTTSNTNDWEYVAQPKHAYGPSGNQTIKYWDYATSQYDFIAYSAGDATAVYATGNYSAASNVLISEIDPSKMNGEDTTDPADGKIDVGAYSIKGKAENLAKVYIADLVTAYNPDDYQNVVQIKFRSLSAKVRIALYETVPGYSVKDVVFYSADGIREAPTSPATWGPAYLYTDGTGNNVFNEEGTYIVYYPTTGSGNKTATDYNKAHLSFNPEASGTSTTKTFGTLTGSLTAEELATAEGTETAGNLYLGRSSNAAIYAGAKTNNYYTTVIPNENGAVLKLKVDYTLISTDGSTEEIHVTGATAQVPAIYTAWKSGYAYTYLFKISQNSNGQTGTGDTPAGLYPITFDAVVMNSEVDGIQETITTVDDPSITTYTKGKIVTANNEYKTGNNIYVVVDNGTELNTSNAKLYTVTLTGTGAAGAAQTINEASVANALAQTGASVTDANGYTLAVTSETGLSIETEIAAEDAPDGNAITVSTAKFTPTSTGTYVFQYRPAVTYTDATAAAYNATLDGAISANDVAYTFTSFASNQTTEYGTGIVKVISTDATSTTVKVLSNNPNDANAGEFVGNEYKVNATTLVVDQFYQLYSGDTALPIYVKVTGSTQAEIDAFNADLNGAKHAGDFQGYQTDAKECKYKIIIVE